MADNNKISLKVVLLILLVLIVPVGLFYKYFEWNSQKQLITLVNKNMTTEMSLEEEKSKYFNDESNPLLVKWIKAEYKDSEEYYSLVDQLIYKVVLTDDLEKNYGSMLVKNKNSILDEKRKVKFLFGSTKKTIDDVTKNLISSYDKSIEMNKKTQIADIFLKEYFTVSKDMEVSNVFFRKFPVGNDKISKYVIDNFSTISSLEKYTRDDFKFEKDDEIKSSQPYGYEVLYLYKDYLKTFYLIMKDYVADDIESAGYKATKLTSQLSNFNIDLLKMFSENSEFNKAKTQEALRDKLLVVETMKKQQITGEKIYPLLGGVGQFKDNLFLCDIYVTKSFLYKEIKNEYPKSTDSKSLVEEMSLIIPKTDTVDNMFDYDVLRVVKNDDVSIKLECIDKETGKSYQYETIK